MTATAELTTVTFKLKYHALLLCFLRMIIHRTPAPCCKEAQVTYNEDHLERNQDLGPTVHLCSQPQPAPPWQSWEWSVLEADLPIPR